MPEEFELEELKSRLQEEFSGYTETAGGKNYRFTHLETVHRMVCKLADELNVDVDRKVLEVAALYHDIGRSQDIEDGEMDPFEGHEGHDERGARMVGDYVSDFVTDEQLEKIQKIIRNHHSEAETVEGKIVQDADKLFNFGVNNLWRQIHYSCQHDREFWESIEYFWDTAVEEFEDQIEELHFQNSKGVARKRLENHKEAVRQMEEEMEAEDF
ncbi:MAG: HD domain-containing protein [Candidatus Nanohalobium sp.]